MQNLRATIGLITDKDSDTLNDAIWAGVNDVARQQDVNLICFAAESLPAPNQVSPANILHELVGEENIDGLIVWGGVLARYVGGEAVRAWCQQFSPLPIVSVALQIEGIPSVMVDNYQGMRQAMEHLIEFHGYKDIAFIRGPQGHPEAEARFQAYLDTLGEHGLPFREDLVQFGGWDSTAGEQATHQLLDNYSGEFKAIAAADDASAIGALKALNERGLQVPYDIALTGFDNMRESDIVTPPLTTVPFFIYQQGYRAAEMMLELLAHKEVPKKVVLATHLIVRQSCGCLTPEIRQIPLEEVGYSEQTIETDPTLQRAYILTKMTQIAAGETQLPSDWAERLLDSFYEALTQESCGVFLFDLERLLRQTVAASGQVTVWHNVISMLRRYTLPCLAEQNVRLQAENLWQQARLMIGELGQRLQAQQHWQAEQQVRAIRKVGRELNTALDIQKLTNILAQELPGLGISSCYLSLYEQADEFITWSRLIMAYSKKGRIQFGGEDWRFLSKRLVPEGVLPHNRRYSLVVESLYFREQQLGFVLFEAGPEEAAVCNALREFLRSGLKGVQLFDKALQAQALAEKADRLKTQLLANVSHELRTPLNVILGHTKAALKQPNSYKVNLPPALVKDMQHIHNNAEHQIRVINDLLDLSRAEIDELDLYPELIQPHSFLSDIFYNMAKRSGSKQEISWQLKLPEWLPVIEADPVRLRQILLNLLSNARKFTSQGQIALGAEVSPPQLHIWVQDTGYGIPLNLQTQIFEPFITTDQKPGGIGLGLTITRRLVALHKGSMRLESQPEAGSTFHIYLPLPSLSDQPTMAPESSQPILLLISSQPQLAPEIVEFSQRQGLEIRRIERYEHVNTLAHEIHPVALAWDLAGVSPNLNDWYVIQQLRKHPRLSRVPFMIHNRQQTERDEAGAGITNIIMKPMSGTTLLEAVKGLYPLDGKGPILIVDDDPDARRYYLKLLTNDFPNHPLRTASNGKSAVTIMIEESPTLVILDLMMPEMDGFEVLEWIRNSQRSRHVPVLVLSNRILTFEDIKRLEGYPQVTIQSKGIWSEREAANTIQRILAANTLPPQTNALVKRMIAYLHQNYHETPSLREMAAAIGVNEDYLGRVFRQELGLSPGDYLNRYRIKQAKELLQQTDNSIMAVAHKVGFKDSAYFSRVFRKLVGQSPSAYRDYHESDEGDR